MLLISGPYYGPECIFSRIQVSDLLSTWVLHVGSFEMVTPMKHFPAQYYHPTGDGTRVFAVPGKVTVKIGDAENQWRGCRDKNRLSLGSKHKLKIKMLKYILFLPAEETLKNLLSVAPF